MMLAERSDRRKTPDLAEYRPMTHEEAKALDYGDHPHVLLSDGRVGVVKVNGAVKTWKRDANRFEVPAKYGLREYVTFVPSDDGRVVSWGLPSVYLLVRV